jgi:ankyrin repeat protein
LLTAGADPRARNADGETPLHWAALSGHIVVVQRLLARGADARQKTAKGFTARDYARREGHPEVAKLLERFDQ